MYEEAEEALKEGNLKQYTDLNRAFHQEIWSAAGKSEDENMTELWNGLPGGQVRYQKRIMRKCRLKNMKGYGEQSSARRSEGSTDGDA